MSRIIVKRVDATKEAVVHCLMWLQRVVLPHDEPREIKGDEWWIAYQDDNPVGFASLRILPTDDGAVVGYLSRAGVLPKARGQGIQHRMIRARLKFAKEAGASAVITDTADNPASANSLIAAGFRMYHPSQRWALPNSTYWLKKLTP